MKLSPIQEKIVETPGDLIVRASAGTGKTHTMVNKIAKEIDDNHTHKVIAAITFTIKAAQEIKDRLSVDVVQHFIGTNNSFVIEEVIKPFMKDVYGADFDLDMSTDYSAKVDTFQEAIEKIRNEGILCSYRDNKRHLPVRLYSVYFLLMLLLQYLTVPDHQFEMFYKKLLWNKSFALFRL